MNEAMVGSMAGGPNAKTVACMNCGEQADRIFEGIEDDQYQCQKGHGFGIDWRRGPPEKPLWPPTPEERAMIEWMIKQRKGK